MVSDRTNYSFHQFIRRYMAEILPIRRKTLSNQSINQFYYMYIYRRIRSRGWDYRCVFARVSALSHYRVTRLFTCSCTNFSEFIKAKKAILIMNKNINITRMNIQENSYFTSTLVEQLLTDSQIAINCRAWLHVFVGMLTLVQQWPNINMNKTLDFLLLALELCISNRLLV